MFGPCFSDVALSVLSSLAIILLTCKRRELLKLHRRCRHGGCLFLPKFLYLFHMVSWVG